MYPVQLDLFARNAVHGMHSATLTTIALAFSFIGSAWALTPLFLLSVGALIRFGHRLAAGGFAVVMAGEVVLQNTLKPLFARTRPEAFFGPLPDSYSFPSGHALSATCFFGALTVIVWTRIADPCARAAFLFGAVVVTLGIGWSRLYLGVHYLSDVVGGYVIGAAWVGVVALLELLRARRDTR